MDSFTKIFYQNPDPVIEEILNKKSFLDLEDSDDLRNWYEAWTELNEIVANQSQLYQVYRWNYLQLINGIHILVNDTVMEVRDNETSKSVQTVLNGYAINMISLGSDLIEFLRGFHRHLSKRGCDVLTEFEQTANREFDDNFYYALLGELRNQAQHGQLLISTYKTEDGSLKACFDLEQIKGARLIKMNGKVRNRIDAAIRQLYDAQSPFARLSLTNALDAFHLSVSKLYLSFLEKLLPYAVEQVEATQKMIGHNRKLVREFPDGVLYLPLLENRTLHVIDAKPQSLIDCITDDIIHAKDDYADAKQKVEIWKGLIRPSKPATSSA